MKKPYDLGYLGGGQLGRMSILSAHKMGIQCLSLDSGTSTPASQVANSINGSIYEVEDLTKIFEQCEKITLENEFIPAEIINHALKNANRNPDCLIPGTWTLGTIQDKLKQREAYHSAGTPSPQAYPLESIDQIERKLAYPLVIKSRFGGYDGKGTRFAHSAKDLESFSDLWKNKDWLAEEFIPFKRELAVMVIRQCLPTGEIITKTFPTMETVQTNHVCDLVFPCEVDASQTAIQAVESVQGFGLFGVELFETKDGNFLINEIAPRPHNSGHYTMDAGQFSQFDLHVRVVLGLELPNIDCQPTCMANLLGQENSACPQIAMKETLIDFPEAHFHWYGKAETRPGRKMGHLNITGLNCKEKAIEARNLFYQAWTNQ